MPGAEFAVHTEVIAGIGSLGRLDEAVRRVGASHLAVAVDETLAVNGLLGVVLDHLSTAPVAVAKFPPNPDVASVESAVATFGTAGADAVLAIGGGSALGGGKAAAIRLTNGGSIVDYEGTGKVPIAPVPTIAIPTTAGSGSEVSNALVLHEPGRSTELVIRGVGCEPRIAILDGRLLRGLPEKPLVYAGLDALTHSLESLWANAGGFYTSALAIRAAQRIVALLPEAVQGVRTGASKDGDNDAVLQELLEASSAANMACGNSGLGLVHALSSSPDVKLAHGLQNGILLPHVAAFNADELGPEGREILAALPALYEALGFDASFAAVAPTVVRAEPMIEASRGHPFRGNNRRSATDEELAELLVAAGATRGDRA